MRRLRGLNGIIIIIIILQSSTIIIAVRENKRRSYGNIITIIKNEQEVL